MTAKTTAAGSAEKEVSNVDNCGKDCWHTTDTTLKLQFMEILKALIM